MKNAKANDEKCSVISSNSFHSETDSVMTKINYNGCPTKINCNPLKLIQFLVSDLRKKLKYLVSDGERRLHVLCEWNCDLINYVCPLLHTKPNADDKEISKVLKEINYAIKQAFLEQSVNGVSFANSFNDGEGREVYAGGCQF